MVLNQSIGVIVTAAHLSTSFWHWCLLSFTMTSFAPGLLFTSIEDGTTEVDLGGRTFNTIADGGSEIVAICNDGLHGVGLEGVHQLTSTVMSNVSGGAGFLVGIDLSHSLYSWGPNGFHGQVL